MTTSTPSGLDLRWVDPAVRPQDDLFAHVNGRLAARRTRSRRTARRTAPSVTCATAPRRTCARSSRSAAARRRPRRAQHRCALRVVHGRRARRGARGRAAAPAARRGRGGADRAALAAVLGRRQRQGRVSLFGSYVTHGREEPQPLPRAPEPVRAGPAGRVVLPRRRPTPRSAPPTSRTSPGSPSWWGCPTRRGSPSRVMELETALAAASWDRVTNRDAEKTYTLMTSARAADERARRSTGTPGSTALRRARRVRSPRSWCASRASSTAAADAVGASARSTQWKAWLATPHHLRLRRLPERRRRAAGLRLLRPHAVGHAGAARALEARRRRSWRARSARPSASSTSSGTSRRRPRSGWTTLVANLVEAYRQSISTLDWMGPATRERALAKLAQVHAQDRLPGQVGGLLGAATCRADDLLGNVLRAGAWRARTASSAKIGKPVDRDEWFMTPQTVNAYYHPRHERDRVPGRDPAAAVLRRRRRRRRQLRRHRRGDRARDRPRLRRPGQQVRRRRQPRPTGGTPDDRAEFEPPGARR